MRKVKIVATLGPSSNSPEKIRELVDAGMNVARLNFSHGTHEEHARAIEGVRRAARETGRMVGILQDLQGVKIRTGRLRDGGPVELEEGSRLTILTESIPGDERRISVDYSDLTSDVREGDRILISDGMIELIVEKVGSDLLETRVVSGGLLRERQGINLPGSRISAPALTSKDLEDLELGVRLGVDYVALSFVRRPEDIEALREKVGELGAEIPVIAKIETPVAVERLDEIVETSDGIMVARGDLGVELTPEEVPIVQKRAVRSALSRNRICIIATQMLESMIRHPLPTRAEASDVANAVLDGADAVMLSGETAVGEFPAGTVRMMARIIDKAEELKPEFPSPSAEGISSEVALAVCEAAYYAARSLRARAIVAFTQSGFTGKLISAFRPRRALFAFTPHLRVARRLALCWGLQPLLMGEIDNVDQLVEELESVLLERGFVEIGDRIAIISGAPIIRRGSTNLLKLHVIGRKESPRECQ